ncbi:MAG TPA: LCP family protein [Candidatus Coprovivens excrementavium]|nr:LCP family protein [Candidatus Coprovivens excrementavium]
MKKENIKFENKRNLIIKIVISLIFIFLSGWLFLSVYKLGIIPNKYLIIFAVILVIVHLISNLCLFSKKKWLKIFTVILMLLLTIVSVFGIKYANDIDNFLDTSLNNAENKLTIDFVLLSKNNYDEGDLVNKEVYYYNSALFIDKALAKLNEKYQVTTKGIDDITKLFDYDIFIMDKTTFYLFVEENGINADDYYLIDELSIEYEIDKKEEQTETTNSKNDNKKQSDEGDYYNIYLGGYDFSGFRMDLNKIITINTKTNEILITSVHRYTYINIPAYNQKNILSNTAYYGINNNIEALEELFDIDIDYYVSVKTNGLVSLVDTIGGIEYCSDQAFTTSHAKVIGTYDDTKGEHVKVKKGCQHLDGIETLTVAREREAFKMGAVQRDKNTTAIMLDILYQMRSPENIMNYTSILNAVGGMYTTSIPREELTEGVKRLLNGGWSIKTQSLSGTNGRNKIHFSNLIGPVNYPKSSSVEKCSKAIKALEN